MRRAVGSSALQLQGLALSEEIDSAAGPHGRSSPVRKLSACESRRHLGHSPHLRLAPNSQLDAPAPSFNRVESRKCFRNPEAKAPATLTQRAPLTVFKLSVPGPGKIRSRSFSTGYSRISILPKAPGPNAGNDAGTLAPTTARPRAKDRSNRNTCQHKRMLSRSA
jgi:hypothetical protein